MRRTTGWVAAATIVVAGAIGIAVAATSDGDTAEGRVDDPNDQPADRPLVVDWFDDTAALDLGNGWTVRSMEGDAPLLLVERHGRPVGAIEAIAFPVDSFDDGADLDALVTNYYADIAADRQQGCGYDIATSPVRDATVGGRDGVSYEFSGPAGGTPTERVVNYTTVAGDQIVIIAAAAHNEGGCIGTEDIVFSTTTLADFAPYLDRIVADTPLPLAFFTGR